MKIQREPLALGDVQEQLVAFEAEHRSVMPQFEEALRTHNAALVETPEFARWSLLRSAVKYAESRQRTSGSPV